MSRQTRNHGADQERFRVSQRAIQPPTLSSVERVMSAPNSAQSEFRSVVPADDTERGPSSGFHIGGIDLVLFRPVKPSHLHFPILFECRSEETCPARGFASFAEAWLG